MGLTPDAKVNPATSLDTSAPTPIDAALEGTEYFVNEYLDQMKKSNAWQADGVIKAQNSNPSGGSVQAATAAGMATTKQGLGINEAAARGAQQLASEMRASGQFTEEQIVDAMQNVRHFSMGEKTETSIDPNQRHDMRQDRDQARSSSILQEPESEISTESEIMKSIAGTKPLTHQDQQFAAKQRVHAIFNAMQDYANGLTAGPAASTAQEQKQRLTQAQEARQQEERTQEKKAKRKEDIYMQLFRMRKEHERRMK